MSWSVNRLGKPAALRAVLAKDFAGITCPEPEQTIKNNVAFIVEEALCKFPPSLAVRVEASGSQYAPDSRKPNELQNTLSVKIEPIYGFVEDARDGGGGGS